MAYNIAPSKQDLLVSGTNIKTINSNSLLGSGNLTVAGLPTSTNPTDADKVVAVDSAGTSSWQYAGLGAGSLGTNNVVLGRSKPSAITTASNLVVIGVGAGNSFTTASKTIAIGTNAVNSNNGATDVIAIGDNAQCGTNGISIGSNTNSNQNSVMIGKGVGNSSVGETVSIGVDSYSGSSANVMIGFQAGSSSSTTNSVFMGTYAGNNSGTGSSHTCVGYGAGFRLSSASSCVFLGNLAGVRSSTQSNELFIDNQDRTNYATQQTNSLIYGVFNATPASQTLTVNAVTTSTYGYLTALGSVSAPTYSFTGDTNTGLWSSAADTVNLSTGGSERLRVDSTGVVRINTTALIGTNVSEKLEVKGVIKAVGTDASNLGWFYAMGDGTSYGGGFQIWKDNSSASNSWAIAMQTPGSAISDDLVISSPDGGWHEYLRIKKAGDVIINETGASVDVRIEGDTDANLLVTDGSADKVGIGTATPQEKLDVGTGNARVSNGDLILNTAGNGIKIKTGTDATAGLATISNGNSSVTVNTNKCSATSIILVTNQTSTAYVAVTTKTSGSFKIEHANTVGADQECAWFIINPA